MIRMPLLPALLLSAAVISGQELTAQLSTVTTATGSEVVQGVLSGQQGLARTADGRLWALTYYNDGKANGAQSMFDRIYVSKDNGKTWSLGTTVPKTGAVRGSIRTGVDGTTLHVVWQGNDSTTTSTSFYTVYYATYDTLTGKWNGTPYKVAAGVNSNDQYQSPDVVVTPGGTVVVAYNGHRQSPSWSGRMRVLKGSTWSAEQRINVDTYGIQVDMQAHGEDVYFAYRTNSGGYGIRCRRYQTAIDKWGAEGEMQVSQANPTNTNPASSGNGLCVLPNGDVYVIYAKGTSSAGKGEIWVGIAPTGTYKFTTHVKVADDAAMIGGNKTYYHYALSRSGTRVNVLYSKLSESNKTLYLRWFAGTTILPPTGIQQATGTANQFGFVSAHRDPLGEHGMMALTTDRGTPNRVQALVAATGFSILHQGGCMGSLKSQPALRPGSIPVLGQVFNLEHSRLPASAPALMLLGANAQTWGPIPLPLKLDGLGMPGCLLAQDILVTAGFVAKGDGTATLPLPIPSLPSLAGVPFYVQSFVIATGANKGNAVMTNGIAVNPR